MTPQTVWIGGKHPCATPPKPKPPKAPFIPQAKWIELLKANPGVPRLVLQKLANTDAKIANTALDRMQYMGRARYEWARIKCDDGYTRKVRIWFPTFGE